MKKLTILALALVLTAGMMTGCRETMDEMTGGDNSSIGDTTAPSATARPTEATKPTAEATKPTTEATKPTDPTKPSAEATNPGPTDASPTDSATATGRGRPSNR